MHASIIVEAVSTTSASSLTAQLAEAARRLGVGMDRVAFERISLIMHSGSSPQSGAESKDGSKRLLSFVSLRPRPAKITEEF